MAKAKMKSVVATTGFSGSKAAEKKKVAEIQSKKQSLIQQGRDYSNIKQYGFAPDQSTLEDIALSEYFMGLDQASANKQMEFQDYMSSTAHQREVEDLKAAGLNPVLSANNGASMGAGALATADTSAISNKTSRQNMSAQLKNQLQVAKMNVDAQIQMNNASLNNALKIAKLNNKTNLSAAKYAANQSYAASVYGSNASAGATLGAAQASAAATKYASDNSYNASVYATNNPQSVAGLINQFLSGNSALSKSWLAKQSKKVGSKNKTGVVNISHI